MYTHYFGLKEKPFSIAPDISFFYMSEQHREALNHLLHGISNDECFTLLTGNVGMGKSSVRRCLLNKLSKETDVVVVANPCVSVLELLSTICIAFEVELDDEDEREESYLGALSSYLTEAYRKGRAVVLIVDEAQNTSLDQLELLCSLATLKSENTQLLKIVLIGQTELSHILNQQDASRISKYISSRYHLMPLDYGNCTAYIAHRLTVAGAKEKIFSHSALNRIFELSHGIPRFINVLCDEAMRITKSREKYLVTGSDVDTAAEKVLGNVVEKKIEVTRKQLWTKVLCGLLIFLVGGGTLSWYFSQKTTAVSSEKQVTEVMQPVKTVIELVDPVVDKVEIAEKAEDKLPKHAGSTIRIVPLEITE